MAMSRAGRKRLILVLAILFLGVAGVGAYALKQAQTQRNMVRWLEEGTAAYEREDYPEALELLSKYVSRDKTNAEVLLDFADTRLRVPLDDGRHIHQARGIIQQALSVEPDSLRGRTMLMEVFSLSGFSTEARDAAERVLQLDPTNRRAHETRLAVFLKMDRQDEIIAAATRMAEALPDKLEVQQFAFETLTAAHADDQVLVDFLDACESRFAGRLGMKLMRAKYLFAKGLEALPDTPEAEALREQFHTSIRLAMELPAQTSQEVIDLVKFLDVFPSTDAEDTLERFMRDPKFAENLSIFAAERAWSRGQFEKAGTLVLTHTTDLTKAPVEALGWVALSGLPEANNARELLATRPTPEAKAWLALAEAHAFLASDDLTAAARAIPNTLPHYTTLETLGQYLRGKVQMKSGELARAAQTWSELLGASPRWSLARGDLAEAYLELGRPLDARKLLLIDRHTKSGYLQARIEVAIDEAGLTRPPPTTQDSYEIITSTLDTLPESPTILCLAARAALATGRIQEAGAFVDRLLSQQPLEASQDIAILATRLTQYDPGKATALRAAVVVDITDPATALMLAGADANAGEPEQGLARLQAGLAQAADADKLDWEILLAHYRDRIGDPEAATRLLELSALHPDNRFVQLTVLKSSSVWNTPASLGPVIQRFRNITGDHGLQWRLYTNKLELALLDRDSDKAVERANSIMFDLVSLIRDDPQNVEALDIFAEAAEIAGDNARAAEYLLRAVLADPKNTARRLKLVNIFLPRAGRLDEARQYARTLADYPLNDPDLLRERARTFERFGFHNLARTDWENPLLAADPTARINRAYILLNSDRAEEADALIAEIITNDSSPEAVLVDAAYYLARRGKIEEGLALFDRLPAQGPLGLREQLAAQYLLANTNTLELTRSLETRALAENTPAMWAAAVQAYMNIGYFDEAQRVASAGLAHHPTAPELTVLTQMFSASEANDPLAVFALLRSRRSFIQTPEADRIITLLDQRLAQQIDDDELIEELEALVEQVPTSFIPREALATAQHVANRPADMTNTLRAAMEALPANPAVARFAAFQFRNVGLNDEALYAARQWQLRLGQPNLAADQLTAELLLNAGRAPEALTTLEPWRAAITEARAEQPHNAFLLASALALSGQSAEALSLLGPLAETPGPGLDYCIMLTPFIAETDEQRQWLENLTPKALTTDNPQIAFKLNHAWWNLASITDIPDDIRTATQTAEALLSKPSGEQFQIRLSAALGRARLGDTSQAAEHYRAMLAIDPTLIDIHNNLAFLLLSTDTGAAEALEHANTAVQLAQNANTPPDHLRSYLDTQALALLANGRADHAVTIFRQILESDPAWPTGILGLTEALLAAGKPDQARQALAGLNNLALSKDQSARADTLRNMLDR